MSNQHAEAQSSHRALTRAAAYREAANAIRFAADLDNIEQLEIRAIRLLTAIAASECESASSTPEAWAKHAVLCEAMDSLMEAKPMLLRGVNRVATVVVRRAFECMVHFIAFRAKPVLADSWLKGKQVSPKQARGALPHSQKKRMDEINRILSHFSHPNLGGAMPRVFKRGVLPFELNLPQSETGMQFGLKSIETLWSVLIDEAVAEYRSAAEKHDSTLTLEDSGPLTQRIRALRAVIRREAVARSNGPAEHRT